MLDPRYSRQVLFNHIGPEGQKKLRDSKVLIVGLGTIGIILSNHMVRAGVGTVKIVDGKKGKDGIPKVADVKDNLAIVNSTVSIEIFNFDLSSDNIKEIAEDVDIIFNGTKEMETCKIINDFCFNSGLPFIFATISESKAIQATLTPDKTTCLDLIVKQGITSSDRVSYGDGPLTNIIASYQAIEGFKLLLQKIEAARNTILVIDEWNNVCQEIEWSDIQQC